MVWICEMMSDRSRSSRISTVAVRSAACSPSFCLKPEDGIENCDRSGIDRTVPGAKVLLLLIDTEVFECMQKPLR